MTLSQIIYILSNLSDEELDQIDVELDNYMDQITDIVNSHQQTK